MKNTRSKVSKAQKTSDKSEVFCYQQAFSGNINTTGIVI